MKKQQFNNMRKGGKGCDNDIEGVDVRVYMDGKLHGKITCCCVVYQCESHCDVV